MKRIELIIAFLLLFTSLRAQQAKGYTYTIKADSVLLTDCDSSELIIQNHTQNIPGFLFNTGSGHTIFKRGMQPIGADSWLVGSDTLNLGAKAWLQGGNSFGAAGILGTLDNNNLAFYTADTERVRVVPRGRVLVGTTTDDSVHLLQVNGNSAFKGNVNIGSATVTNTGLLIGTDAILFNHVASAIPGFQQNDIYVSKLDNVLYNYQYRFNTTSSVGSDGTLSLDIKIPPYELAGPGIVYPQGKMCFSFWEGGIPQSISVQMYDSLAGVWFGPMTTSTNLSPQTMGYFEITIPGAFNWLTEIKIAMTPPAGGGINLQNLEYVLSDPGGLANPFPYVGKTGTERLYNFMYFGTGANNVVCLSPLATYPSYFLNNMGIGTSSPTAQLHTTGSVRFAGLTGDNTQNLVLVSDTAGNIFLRSASTLAETDAIRSSLAVNGPIQAQKLTLSAKDWPDYVFDSTYQLPKLTEVESFIHREHHLPGIPGAATIQKDSLDVGANQAALLKKIEELTLYTIEQDKKMAAMQARMETLEKIIADKTTKP